MPRDRVPKHEVDPAQLEATRRQLERLGLLKDDTMWGMKGNRALAPPTLSIAKLTDPEHCARRVHEFGLFMDLCASPISRALSKGARMTTSKLVIRARRELADWFMDEFCEGRLRMTRAPDGRGPEPFGNWVMTRESDLYIATRVMSMHCVALKGFARKMVNWMNAKHGGPRFWEDGLGLRRGPEDTFMLAFGDCSWEDKTWKVEWKRRGDDEQPAGAGQEDSGTGYEGL
jgi:hypothetical protein